MAMTSASFMGMGGYTTVLVSKLDKIDCSQVLSAVLVADRQLLGHIKMGPTANNPEVNWIEDSLVGATFNALLATGGNGSVSVSLIGMTTASATHMFRSKTLIKAVSAEDIYRVDTVGGAALQVTIYASGTHVASGSTSQWIVIGNPYSDVDDASSDISQSREKKRNFTQVFERAVEITQTRKGIDMESMVNELQTQIKYRTLEMKRELDIAVINSIANYDATQKTGQSEWRTMQGIVNFIRDPNFDNTNETSALVTSVSGALTVANLNSLLYDIWNAGGLDEMSDPIIVVGAAQQRVLAAMEKDIRRVEQGERQIGYYRDIFLSDMGVELPIVLDRWVSPTKLIVLDRARVALRGFAGDTWHAEKMAKTGRVEKWQLSGQYTLEMRNADKCHGLLMNLT